MPIRTLQVHGYQRLIKAGPLHTALALAVTDKRGAIEHQLILAPDQVAIQHRQTSFTTAGLDLLQTLRHLVGPERRGIEVEHHIHARLLQLRSRLGMPDVLTDGQPQRPPLQLKGAGFVASLKVTLFIKHPVIGQVLFEIFVPGAFVSRENHP